jgi:hypothetical protein
VYHYCSQIPVAVKLHALSDLFTDKFTLYHTFCPQKGQNERVRGFRLSWVCDAVSKG